MTTSWVVQDHIQEVQGRDAMPLPGTCHSTPGTWHPVWASWDKKGMETQEQVQQDSQGLEHMGKIYKENWCFSEILLPSPDT